MDLTDSIAPRSDQIETWLPVADYEGIYQVSDLGRVRSLHRLTSNGRRRPGVTLKPIPMPRGYLFVNLWRANQKREVLVQRLVLTAFVGPQPVGMEALHRDNNPGNNSLTNLHWGTHSENQYDQVAHGTHRNASKDQCPAGHPYDAANTYTYPGRTKRGCRTCRRDYAREYRRKAA
jgi:hypothetical protein